MTMQAKCQGCGETIEAAPTAGDEWTWGSTATYPEGYWEPDFWEKLAERDIAAYSLLRAIDGLGTWIHTHSPAPGTTVGGPALPAPECCSWPMRYAPSGWRCRQGCGGHLPID